MKLTLTFLILIISLQLNAQNVDRLMRRADSLKTINPDSTLLNYYKAVMLVLEDKEVVDDRKWFRLLMDAGNSVSKTSPSMRNSPATSLNYWGMAKGSAGEKLAEKIDFLKEYGVTDMVIYYLHGGQTRVIWLENCSSNVTKFLLWVYEGKTYVQQFDECKSYKPMVTAGSVFSRFYLTNKDSLVKEKLLEVVKITHQDIYELTFVSPGKEDRKIIVDEYNLIKPADKWGNAPLANYNLNMQTKLSRFIPIVQEEVKKYRLMITSGAERAKVGKMP